MMVKAEQAAAGRAAATMIEAELAAAAGPATATMIEVEYNKSVHEHSDLSTEHYSYNTHQ